MISSSRFSKTVVQSVEGFVLGAAVRFTDNELIANDNFRKIRPEQPCYQGDWVIAHEADKEGFVYIQRPYQPATKIRADVRFLYLIEG